MSPAQATTAEAFAAIAEERRSWLGWTGTPVPIEQLIGLVRLAHLSPSECNTQPWRFVIAQDGELDRLLPAFLESNRPKLREAATLVAVFGDTATIDASPKAAAFYARSRFTRGDFATRNASLAAMAFMHAATAAELATRPMVGFDPEALVALTRVPSTWLPVLCLAVGHPGEGRHEPRDRLPVEQVVRVL